MTWRTYSKGQLYDANESTVVYYDAYSGDTHLLSDFAGYVMQLLNSQPLSTEELVTRASQDIDPEDIPDLENAITGVLKELVLLDILKP
mgnify:CR=1 FL=1|tara:strand:+ start:788 stop:1054 length:267 start_codon:yes stop_codon:yes gene_type:complete